MASIGIDIGGTRIKVGILKDGKLKTTSLYDVQYQNSLQKELPHLESIINQQIREHLDNEPLNGFGISLPCIVDSRNNMILSNYIKFPDATSLDLEHWVNKNWNTHLRLENDARSALVGEWQYGAGQHINNLVMITLGTGLGSAVLIDGSILRGHGHVAGNLAGHMTIDFQGVVCNCGDIGCTEAVASTWSISDNLEYFKTLFPDTDCINIPEIPDYQWVFNHAQSENPFAQWLRHRSLEAWSAMIKNLIYAYDPSLIILSGGLMGSEHMIVPYFQTKIKEYSWLNDRPVQIKKAMHAEWAGVLGVAWLAGHSQN
ncbi:MAG TPA: ROK family protein [Saprospiraceae bacterium]|nr:ROK family protein [Saprospiraceae bacterium]